MWDSSTNQLNTAKIDNIVEFYNIVEYLFIINNLTEGDTGNDIIISIKPSDSNFQILTERPSAAVNLSTTSGSGVQSYDCRDGLM